MKLVRFRALQRSYRPKATVEVRVTQPRRIGTYTRVRTSKGEAPLRIDCCPMPGKTSGEMPDGLSLRTTALLMALAFGLPVAIQALRDAGSSTAKPATLTSAPGAETGPALAVAVSVPALGDASTRRKTGARKKAVERVDTAAQPAPRLLIPAAPEPPAPTPTLTPRYVAPAPRYVAPRATPKPTSTPAPETTASPSPTSGEFDTIGEKP